MINILCVKPTKELLEALACDPFNVIYMSKEHLIKIKDLSENKLNINFIKCNLSDNFIISSISILKGFYLSVKNKQIDMVLINAIRDLPAIILAQKIFIRNNEPIIFLISHSAYTFRNKIKSIFALYLIKKYTSGVISLSKAQAKYFKSKGIHNTVIIPNTYSNSYLFDNNYTENSNIKDKNIIKLSYVACIKKEKAQHVGLEAIKILKDKFRINNIQLQLVGSIIDKIYKKKLEKYIKENKLEENIIFLGLLNHIDVIKVLKETDIVIFTSNLEVQPRAIIEAMALKKPIIASEIDGVVDLIENYKSGILVPPNNPYRLAEEIYNLIINKKISEKISTGAYEYIKEYCSHQRIRLLLLRFYVETQRKKKMLYKKVKTL
jgi:glycosyltransferase involved in cell wall biosynthesis